MSRIIIEYNPNLTAIAQQTIEKFVTPSMTSNDESSNQYDIDMVAETLEENKLIKDLSLVNQLREENVNYVEF
jgi:hypothetical protein